MSSNHAEVDEKLLKSFFKDSSQALLSEAVKVAEGGGDTTQYRIEPLEEHFAVKPEHLVRVCDSFLRGEVGPAHLRAIAFTLRSSEDFYLDAGTKDGLRAARVLDEWVAPEINRPISEDNVRLWRGYLEGRIRLF